MADSLRITGVAAVQKALFKFNADVGEKLTKQAFRKGGNFMKAKLKNATPVKTGLSRKSLKVYNSKLHSHKKDGIVSVWVGWRRGTGNRILKGKAPKAVPYYISWVEYGYNSGSKRAGVGLAETLGLIAKGTKAARKLAGIQNRKNNRGKSQRIRQKRLITRYGGKRVEGRHFVERTYNSYGNQTVKIITDFSNDLINQAIKDVGFKNA